MRFLFFCLITLSSFVSYSAEDTYSQIEEQNLKKRKREESFQTPKKRPRKIYELEDLKKLQELIEDEQLQKQFVSAGIPLKLIELYSSFLNDEHLILEACYRVIPPDTLKRFIEDGIEPSNAVYKYTRDFDLEVYAQLRELGLDAFVAMKVSLKKDSYDLVFIEALIKRGFSSEGILALAKGLRVEITESLLDEIALLVNAGADIISIKKYLKNSVSLKDLLKLFLNKVPVEFHETILIESKCLNGLCTVDSFLRYYQSNRDALFTFQIFTLGVDSHIFNDLNNLNVHYKIPSKQILEFIKILILKSGDQIQSFFLEYLGYWLGFLQFYADKNFAYALFMRYFNKASNSDRDMETTQILFGLGFSEKEVLEVLENNCSVDKIKELVGGGIGRGLAIEASKNQI